MKLISMFTRELLYPQCLFLLISKCAVFGDGGICMTQATDSVFSLTSTTKEGSFSSELAEGELLKLPELKQKIMHNLLL